MASTSFSEKDPLPSPPPAVPSGWSFFNPVSPIVDVYERLSRFRADLDLPHPGSVENLQKEVKGNSFCCHTCCCMFVNTFHFKLPIYPITFSMALALT